MSRDILAQLGKKGILPKRVAPVNPLKPYITPLSSSSRLNFPVHSDTHNYHIHDNLIKIIPKDSSLLNNKKIYAFDLDSTLIRTKSGRTFAVHSQDWQWCFDTVLDKLVSLSKKSHTIVIFSNQGGVIADSKTSKSLNNFIFKIKNILEELNKNNVSNVWIYSSTRQSSASKKKGVDEGKFSKYRKPEVGMYKEFKKEYSHHMEEDLKNENVVYIGDAAGRITDFSDSDLKFAKNCEIEFRMPEDFFS